MFRSSKKKGRKQVIRTLRKDGDSSEEDDNPTSTIVIKRRKTRKKKGMVVRSLEGESTSTVILDGGKETKSKKRKKSNSTGMGFGGGITAAAEEGDNKTMQEETTPQRALYGKDALKKLKAEQKTTPAKERVQNVTLQSEPAGSIANVGANDFIGLREESTTETNKHDTSYSVPNSVPVFSSSLMVEEETEDSNEWQNQVAKRAGLSSFDHENTKAKTPPSLEDLKVQLNSTLANLENQQEDLGNAIKRRQADLQQAKADRILNEETLRETGKACEYYQCLRNDIANWVGALRDLQSKVKPVFEALLQLFLDTYGTAEEEWKRCPEDVFSVLHQMNAIDQVVGYQPHTPTLDFMTVTVDEFGRDVKSQLLRDRDKRYKTRLEHKALEPEDPVLVERSLDYLWLEGEKLNGTGRKERYEYLQQALRVAIEDLDADYTSLKKLIGVFYDWKQSYPEDYRQCYAVLSLGDLAATLVQADFCMTSSLFSMFASDLESSKDDSLSLLKILEDIDDGIGLEQGDSGAIQRVLEHNHVALVLEILKEWPSGCFISSKRSKALCQTVMACAERIDKNTKTYSRIQQAVCMSIEKALGRISIVILKKDFDPRDVGGVVPKEQVEYALQYACSEQAKWTQHLLMNIMDHWLIALQSSPHYEAAMERILQFVSESFLHLLSSMDKDIASMVFCPIWTTLCKSHAKVIESPTFVVQSASVRAAAIAYGLN